VEKDRGYFPLVNERPVSPSRYNLCVILRHYLPVKCDVIRMVGGNLDVSPRVSAFGCSPRLTEPLLAEGSAAASSPRASSVLNLFLRTFLKFSGSRIIHRIEIFRIILSSKIPRLIRPIAGKIRCTSEQKSECTLKNYSLWIFGS
jgi:hypothetical protein